MLKVTSREGILDELGGAQCYVLENGQRVLTLNGGVRIISGAARERGDFGKYIDAIPPEFRPKSVRANFVEFQLPTGGTALGIDSDALMDVCHAYDDALVAGKLRKSQRHLALNARKVIRANSKIGLIALIDEATGYELERAQGELTRLLGRLLRTEPESQTTRYTSNFVDAMATLYRKKWDGTRFPHWLESPLSKIYKTVLGSTLYRELHARCPKPERGNNKHLWLQEEVQSIFERDLGVIELLARQSRTKEEFWMRMNAHYRNEPLQYDLGMN
jgi:hypothetical protein